MRSPVGGARPSGSALVVFAAVAATLIYLLPLHVPVNPAVSESYVYGFNNRVSLGAFLCCAAFWGWWARGLDFQFPAVQESRTASRRPLYAALVVTAFFTTGTWLLNRQMGAFDEAVYGLTRMQEYMAGGSLYHGVEYIYGPLLFMPPVWVARLFHLSGQNAYFSVWVVEWVVGVWMLWKTIYLAVPQQQARTVFLWFTAFYLLTLEVVFGHNFTPLRFMLAPLLCFAIYREYRQPAPPLRIFGLASAGTSITVFFSPEQGLALLVATIFFFVVCLRKVDRSYLAGYLMYGLTAALSLVALRQMGALAGASAVGGGALNMPILFCPQNAVVFAFLMVLTVALNRARMDGRLDHPLVYLCSLSVVLLPSVFGRCDIEHVVLGTTPALLAAFAVFSRSDRSWRVARAAFVFGVLAPVILSQLRITRGLFLGPLKPLVYALSQEHPSLKEAERRMIRLVLGRSSGDIKIATSREKLLLGEQVSPVPDAVLMAPLSYRPPVRFREDLPRVDTGKFNGLEDVVTTAAVDEKIGELVERPERALLLQAEWQSSCELDGGGVDQLMKVTFFPVHVPAQRHTVKVFEPLCGYIAAHYRMRSPLSPFAGYGVWSRER